MKTLLTSLIALLTIFTASISAEAHESSENGLVKVVSENDFATTVSKMEKLIEKNPNLKLLWRISHDENAKSAGLELRPTTLLVFGNPKMGTPLMKEAVSMGLDLPQKFLIVENDGEVSISYNDPKYLARRHGLSGQEERLVKISGALKKLSQSAASK